MSQVIVRADSTAFYYALGHNRRRRAIVHAGCSTPEEISVQIADFQRAHHTPANFRNQNERTEALEAVSTVRLAVAPGQDKRGGYVLLGGLLVGLHHIDAGHGDWLMRDALDHGADRLECYGTPYLLNFYVRHGFRVVGSVKNWVPGGPDVVHMRKVP